MESISSEKKPLVSMVQIYNNKRPSSMLSCNELEGLVSFDVNHHISCQNAL